MSECCYHAFHMVEIKECHPFLELPYSWKLVIMLVLRWNNWSAATVEKFSLRWLWSSPSYNKNWIMIHDDVKQNESYQWNSRSAVSFEGEWVCDSPERNRSFWKTGKMNSLHLKLTIGVWETVVGYTTVNDSIKIRSTTIRYFQIYSDALLTIPRKQLNRQ